MTDVISVLHAQEELMTDQIYKFVPLLKENEYVARPRPGWYTESELSDARAVAAMVNFALMDFGVQILNRDILAYNNEDKTFRRTDKLFVHKINYSLVKLDGLVCCPWNWKSASAYYLFNERGEKFPGQTFSQVSACCPLFAPRDMSNSGKEELDSYLASKGYIRSNATTACNRDHSNIKLPRVLHRQYGYQFCCYIFSYPTFKRCEVETYHLGAEAVAKQEVQRQLTPGEVELQKISAHAANLKTAQRIFTFWAAQDYAGLVGVIPAIYSPQYTSVLHSAGTMRHTSGHAGIKAAYHQLLNVHKGRYNDCVILPPIENIPNKVQGTYKVRYPDSSWSCNVTYIFDDAGLVLHADLYSKQIQ